MREPVGIDDGSLVQGGHYQAIRITNEAAIEVEEILLKVDGDGKPRRATDLTAMQNNILFQEHPTGFSADENHWRLISGVRLEDNSTGIDILDSEVPNLFADFISNVIRESGEEPKLCELELIGK
ncbi:uncharacterized protein RCO7_00617 [Rhynchosporium graminicola]|uniref:Uncharacterized protein n=1 Tax=Rhynchosporium graminicola TaxID=2792576 RepID=A0A1E1KR36_9HELO|nr:uncharacterized protein RCO7_00617 [Rhynchosporium commune]